MLYNHSAKLYYHLMFNFSNRLDDYHDDMGCFALGCCIDCKWLYKIFIFSVITKYINMSIKEESNSA
ncbi:hypothetical protein TNCT_255171 [Trichonephila clavata]|uniref:Uncharacterized protein n=1 Tax=Trichonephila clavata TaxID=2740835 RepID=A0A8X6LC39_TRICU|nr:hypothetical protein TNCT_255171 [Trichonephila clavata]